MKLSYLLLHHFIVYSILVSLCLQSCTGLNNAAIPIKQNSTQQTQRIAVLAYNHTLFDLEFQMLQSDGVTFDQEEARLRAEVEEELPGCGGSGNLPVEEEPATTTTIEEGQEQGKRKKARTEIREEQEQNLIEQERGVSSFDILPLEIWQEIFSYLEFEDILWARAVNRNWNEMITGFPQVGIVGVENNPRHIISTHGWTRKKEINFGNNKLKTLTPATIPSFYFYHLIGCVNKIRKEYWPYLQGTRIHTVNLSQSQIGKQNAEGFSRALQGTQVHTVDLSYNRIGDQGAERFAKYLKGTHVYTVDLSRNQIGDQGAEGFAKHLQGTCVHRVNLSRNRIGDQGAEGFAKHLQGTCVHRVNLSRNRIGDQGAIEFAKYLKATRVHTVDLSENRIGDQGAEEFAKNLQWTRVYTVDLSRNQIGDQGAEGFARALQGTQVHTVNLRINFISINAQQLLKEQYPHIGWIF